MELTQKEMEMVASLRENQAFKLLLDAIKADIDTLLVYAEESPTEYEERKHLNAWRVMRRVHVILQTTPEMIVEALNQVEDAFRDPMLDE